MKLGPRDYEIDEIGLEEIFEDMVPGSDRGTSEESKKDDSDTTQTGIDDPFGF